MWDLRLRRAGKIWGWVVLMVKVDPLEVWQCHGEMQRSKLRVVCSKRHISVRIANSCKDLFVCQASTVIAQGIITPLIFRAMVGQR